MTERIVNILAGPDSGHRVLIVRRTDGRFSYRQQWLADTEDRTRWGPPGPFAGIYDSAQTAELEAFARVKWSQGSCAIARVWL